MTTMPARAQTGSEHDGARAPTAAGDQDFREEHTTETRRSFATSEFWLFIILSVALLFFAYESGGDSFARDDGWRYVTWLSVGYFVSRGLAKAGSFESYLRDRGR